MSSFPTTTTTTTAAALLPPLLRPRCSSPPAALRLLLPLPPAAGPCGQGVGRRPEKDACFGRWRSPALSKPRSPVLQLQEEQLQLEDDAGAVVDDDDELLELYGQRGIWQMVHEVKAMLRSMGDGEISVSAYDTAWVAMVKDHLEGSGGRPKFPSCLQWIVGNQLADGSWGDAAIFSAHDRMINTLACVVALKTWNLHPDRCERGVAFVCENMWRLGEEEAEQMPIGFEVAFLSLMDIAKALGLEISYRHPSLQVIYAKRDLKMERIPKQVLHQVPTTLLHSLEGMPGLDWGRLLSLQCADGSFLFSPSSTAYALMQTGDDNCLKYLQNIVRQFRGGVPNVYPVDLFERLWAVDRLERLGISRYFGQEIEDCLDYVHSYWTEEGICWAKNSRVHDIDDTAMGFRLLRLHGYNVSSSVFQHFEKDGEFVCFAGQSNQAVTGMYNLNRASQVAFPGEEILERARSFSYSFLREKRAAKQLLDKWIITKDLPGEVEYALDFPWYASLPRVEARLYLEQYGGESDVWIGKTLYRMPLVNNDAYLELAKADFNQCQALHQLEWLHLQKWYEEVGLGCFGLTKRSLLENYYLAVACIFEPDRATERLGWVRTAVAAKAISTYFGSRSCTDATRQAFISDFIDDIERTEERPVALLRDLVDWLVSSTRPAYQQQRVRLHLREAWKEWLMRWRNKDEEGFGREDTALLLVKTIEICAGRFDLVESFITHPDYDRLAHLLSSICHHLQLQQKLVDAKETVTSSSNMDREEEEEEEMKELAQCVLQASESLHMHQTKQTFLVVAKSFYYAAHCSVAALNTHISKVLFEPVD